MSIFSVTLYQGTISAHLDIAAISRTEALFKFMTAMGIDHLTPEMFVRIRRVGHKS